MMKAKHIFYETLISMSVILLGLSGISWTQDADQVPFGSNCYEDEAVADNDNYIVNGDFSEGDLQVGLPPDTGWMAGEQSAVLQMNSVAADLDNYFLEFTDAGSSISTVPSGASNYTKYVLSFCVIVPEGGQIQIYVGGALVAGAPAVVGPAFNGLFTYNVLMNIASGSQSDKTIQFYYQGDLGAGPAYIDHVRLVPDTSSTDDNPTPTPTVEEPTPTPPPSGPTPTPTPTLVPGRPTPTPTPAITANSVQMTVNPPMLVVSPDDFAATSSSAGSIKKQVSLDLEVIGSNGEKINILDIDKDATIRFIVDTRGEAENVGFVQGFEADNSDWTSINNRRIDLDEFINDYGGRAYFFPTKAYTGAVRVIAEIEYDGWANGKEESREIRGVAPIVLQVDKSSSLTDVTGTYNAMQNYNLGKKAGDRGFRPDMRTNLYFRERMQ
ncbi:MAG: hypothetical protein JXR73_00310 [Candidatus Omnitrophica bacterium]|nr:hypothetical protein [Candidatus Omnitrophota bacterium]